MVGLTAKTLVMITAYQYGLVDGEVLGKYLDGYVFPRAKRALVEYAIRNNYIKALLCNDVIREYVLGDGYFAGLIAGLPGSGVVVEGMSLDAVGTREVHVFGSELSEGEREFEELFLDVVRAEKSDDLTEKILVADRLIHYQHRTGNFLDEDIVREYWVAERIIERLFGV